MAMSQTERDRRIELWRNSTTEEAARQIGIKPRSLARWINKLRRRGFDLPEKKRGRRPKEPLGKAIDAIRDNALLSHEEIAKKYNVPLSYVDNLIKRAKYYGYDELDALDENHGTSAPT